MAREYRYTREQFIGHPREKVFSFFADPANLERITPPWLRFKVVTTPPRGIRPGTRIGYRLRLRGLPLAWTTEITEWDPPRCFADVQIRGPYRLWVHTHEFHPVGGGTLVRDQVRYELPLGRVGDWVGRWLVARDVARIFDYRRSALEVLFGEERAIRARRPTRSRHGYETRSGLNERLRGLPAAPTRSRRR